MEEYTIFIGSPSDVQEERVIIEEIIEEMNGYYEHLDVPKLKVISLKKDVRSKIGNFEGQAVIDKQIEDKYNVFIGILWKKFGTKTENYDSGTEQEFYNAFDKYEKNPKSMEIMFYFCDRAPKDLKEVDGEQLALVQKFRKKLEDKGLYKTYSSIDEFRDLIKSDLKLLVTERNIDFEDSSDEESEENDGLIDLIEDFTNSFNESVLEMEKFSGYIYKTENDLNELNNKYQNDQQNMDIMKKYFNSVAKLLEEFSEESDFHGNIIVSKLNEGISSFNSLISIHGDFILTNDEIYEVNESMNSCYYSIDELNKYIKDFSDVLKGIPRVTTKFSRSKNKLEKSLSNLLKKLIAIEKDIKESQELLLEFKKD